MPSANQKKIVFVDAFAGCGGLSLELLQGGLEQEVCDRAWGVRLRDAAGESAVEGRDVNHEVGRSHTMKARSAGSGPAALIGIHRPALWLKQGAFSGDLDWGPLRAD